MLFEECSQLEIFGPLYSMGFPPAVMFIITQCDLAKAIANVTWVGPIACEQFLTLPISCIPREALPNSAVGYVGYALRLDI